MGLASKNDFMHFFFRQAGHVDDWANIPNVLFIQFFMKNKIKVHLEYLPNTSTQSFDEKKKCMKSFFINKFIFNVQINSYNIYVKL